MSACELTDTFPEAQVGVTPLTETEKQNETSLQQVSLIYFSDKNLHPLLDPSIANQQLHLVVYLPAFTFDEHLSVVYGCATDVTVNGDSVVITPDTSRHFSDGSQMTASAMAESYRFVLSHPESPYYRQLSLVKSVETRNGKVVLSLKSKHPAALYGLSIPIVKSAETKEQTTYYGCGDYCFSKYNNVPVLAASPHAESAPAITPVYLLDPKDETALNSMFNSGVLDVLPAALLGQTALNVTRSYQSVSYLNQTMLFVGINYENKVLTKSLRQALSTLIPREQIVQTVLMGGGVATRQPLYPYWDVLEPDTQSDATKEEAAAAFTEAGYTLKEGVLTGKDGTPLELELLVNEQNKIHTALAEKLRAAAAAQGLKLTVVSVDQSQFNRDLENGNFDLYIARYTCAGDLDPSALYTAENPLNYGAAGSSALSSAYQKFITGKKSAANYVAAFQKECPILPIAYLKDTLYYTTGLTPDGAMSITSPLGDLAKWTAK